MAMPKEPLAKEPRETLNAIGQQAVAWYRTKHRDLPWRRTRNPYHIWISECMLQQTQVATVIPYFQKFLLRFPDVESLAAAELDEVYQLWAGLGYYRRARQLHAAAQKVVETNSAPFPNNIDDILDLPGIGKYTAHAIASFAFDSPCGIVEANTQRLYARLIGCKSPISSSSTQKTLWEYATSLVKAWALPSGELNQALMEIGSQVCKPKDPLCSVCPLQSYCTAYRLGQTDTIPPPKEKKVITPLRETALLLQAPDGNWMLRRCKPSERWAGLWDFPRYDTTDSQSDQQAAQIAIDRFHENYGVQLSIIRKCTELQHSVTRYRIRLDCYQAALPKKLTTAQQQQLFGKARSEKSQSDGASTQPQSTGQGRGANILKEATPGRKSEINNRVIDVKPESETDVDELAWLPLSELRNIALSSSGRKLCKWLESAS